MDTASLLTLVIQAGGESSRMGKEKGLQPFLEQPLVLRTLDRLRPLAAEIFITTNRPQAYAFLGERLQTDLLPERSALGGLYTALSCASQPYVAVVACDMPFASPALLEAAQAALLEHAADLAIPQSSGGLEPFHAVYRRDACLPHVLDALQAGKRRMDAWFSAVKMHLILPDTWQQIDPEGLAFLNVNTPAELQQAEATARRLGV
ncbi:MAG: molybdenum cofactor guanylyltransferase [Anaerolineales bacterium]|jgi:molybdopterin-guanine dinucleotide biosynthesis protein A|nr:molybdenum cofactor guanylyltransferase [Anaerolineales bacterium]